MKPFYFYQFPLFLSSYQHVKFLKERFGFDMFDDILDHSYDNEPDERMRLVMFFNEIKRLNENKELLKPYIEAELGKLYINFNKVQKKDNRNIKSNINEKINEYKEYRSSECTLDNGYIPPIINGIIN